MVTVGELGGVIGVGAFLGRVGRQVLGRLASDAADVGQVGASSDLLAEQLDGRDAGRLERLHDLVVQHVAIERRSGVLRSGARGGLGLRCRRRLGGGLGRRAGFVDRLVIELIHPERSEDLIGRQVRV